MLASWSGSLEDMLEAELHDMIAAPPPAATPALPSGHHAAAAVATHGGMLLDEDALLVELCHDDVYTRAVAGVSAADAAASFGRAHSEPLPAQGADGTAAERASPPSVHSSWQAPALLLDGAELTDSPAGAVTYNMAVTQQGVAAGAPCWPGAFSAHDLHSAFEPVSATAGTRVQLQQPAVQPAGRAVSSGQSLSAGTRWAPQQPHDGNAPVLLMLPWSMAMTVVAGGAGASLVQAPGAASAARAAATPAQQPRRAPRVKRCVSESVLQPQSRFKAPRPAGVAAMQPTEAGLGSECQLRELLRKHQQRLRVQAKVALLQRQQSPSSSA